jgi:hypothetical protein
MCDTRGSIGIDSDGNIFASGSNFVQDVWRFSPPYPVPAVGKAHSANAQIFKPYIIGEMNHTSLNGLAAPRGVAVWGSQLIVADTGRLLFWNRNVWDLSNGQPADGFVGSPSASLNLNPHFSGIRVDENNNLWAMRGDSILVYKLPLTSGELPYKTLQAQAAAAGGGTFQWSDNLGISGIAVSSDSNYVWVGDPDKNRAFRIRSPLTNPVVDIILGQTSLTGDQCNQGAGASMTATTLCNPAHVTLDDSGNLFLSDHSLEARGNFRMLEFDASLFPASPSTVVFAIPATRVYGANNSMTGPTCQDALCGPWAAAFNSSGDMFVGLNAYLGQRFPLVYFNPLTDATPDEALRDYYSMAVFSYVDQHDNLYVTDMNRGRVLVYLETEDPFQFNVLLPIVKR